MRKRYSTRHPRASVLVFLLALSAVIVPQTPAQAAKPAANKPLTQDQIGELQLASARTNPLQLRQFLKKMPKGTDLHYHLVGGVYAETFIHDAVEDGLCVDTKELQLIKCESTESPGNDQPNSIVPARSAYQNQTLYDQLVDSFS